MTDFYATTAKHIAEKGQSLVGVFAESEGDVPFVYTIGNHEAGLPELIMVGDDGRAIGPVLNFLGAKMRDEQAPLPVGLLDIGGRFPIKIVEATNKAKVGYTFQVREYYGTEDYKVLQIVVCDTAGRFPGEEGCEPPYSKQPNLGDD